MDEAQALLHKPKLIYCDAKNGVRRTSNTIPVQMAA